MILKILLTINLLFFLGINDSFEQQQPEKNNMWIKDFNCILNKCSDNNQYKLHFLSRFIKNDNDTGVSYISLFGKLINGFKSYDSLYVYDYFNYSSSPTIAKVLIIEFKDSTTNFMEYDYLYGEFKLKESQRFKMRDNTNIGILTKKYKNYIKDIGQVFSDGCTEFFFIGTNNFRCKFY